MNNKDIFTNTPLPVYEVTEMTVEEALLALSGHRDNRTKSGIMSGEVLNQYYQQHTTSHRQR